MLLLLQDKAIKENKVELLNKAWAADLDVPFRIKRLRDGSWARVSLNGRPAIRLAETAQHWLPLIEDEPAVLELWRVWCWVMRAGRAMLPTREQRRQFGPRCKQLYRLFRSLYHSERSIYLHTLAAHGELAVQGLLAGGSSG